MPNFQTDVSPHSLKIGHMFFMSLFTGNSPYYHLLKYLLFLLKHPVYNYTHARTHARTLVANLRKRSQYFFLVLVLCLIFYIFSRYLVWSCYILLLDLSLQAPATKHLCPQYECLLNIIAPTSETMCSQLSMSCKLL